MQLEDYINNELNIKCLKLKSATYDESNRLELNFVCAPELELTEEFKSKLESDIISFLNIKGLKLILKFKQNIVDTSQIIILFRNYFEKNNPSILTLTNLSDISFDIENSIYNVQFSLDSSAFAIEDKFNLQQELAKLLSQEFFADFVVVINEVKSDLSLSSILKENDHFNEELALLRQTSKPDFETYEFFKSSDFLGQMPNQEAVRLDCIQNYDGQIVIAGTTEQVNKVFYTPKNIKEGQEAQEKVRLTFTLRDYWGEMNCVYFPTQKTQNLLDDILDGMQIAVLGEKNEFNGKVNFKVKAISAIVMPEKVEDSEQFREPFEDYLVVKPFSYEEQKQLNLLDVVPEKVSPYLMENDIVVYDFETNGLSADTCQVIEIGAVKVHQGKITEIFSTFIRASEPLPEVIVNLTHITDEMLTDAPAYELAFADFYKFCQGCILAGYNNLEFDTKFLKKAWKNIGFKFDFKEEDAYVLARQKLRLSNYKLGTVVKALDIELVNAHRAYADATATAKAFIKLINN